VCYTAHLFAGYLFGFLLLEGCQHLLTGRGNDRWKKPFLGAAGVVALVLPYLPLPVNLIFAVHHLALAGFYAAGFVLVQRSRGHLPDDGTGWRVVRLALALAAGLDLPLWAWFGFQAEPTTATFPHLEFVALYELLLQVLLAFGMVILVMEKIRAELEASNRELTRAGVRLQALAKQDPLTEALNRHAFDSMLRKQQRSTQGKPFNGTVAVIDVDDLKPINDTYGHAAGDAAIRAVAGAVRRVIRADDLVFRWGGDEFVVVLLNVTAEEARARFGRLPDLLGRTALPGAAEPVDLVVSVGVAAFDQPAKLEPAIERADLEMYAIKQARKANRDRPVSVVP
jgi:diguanylate cyclase (GGDEF)-like protein